MHGELRVAPIGIPDGAPESPAAGVIGEAILELAPKREAGSTKFTSGQVVLAGASRGLTGAVCLAAEAAIRAGAGYATVAVPAALEPIFEQKLTEVMSVGCPGREGLLGPDSVDRALQAFEGAAAGVLGPGLGRDPGQRRVRSSARHRGAGAAADRRRWAERIRRAPRPDCGQERETVLTPHAGELGRLLGRPSAGVSEHRLAAAKEAARAAAAIVVLKGDDTIVTDGTRVAVNAVSAPALATAGTGDVLSGITAALLARADDPFAATCTAVLAHARAGRDAARRIGAPESVIAGDVIASIAAGLRPDLAVD